MFKTSPRNVVFGRQPARAERRLCVESLEDRRVLATFLVTSTNDAGDGTLRQAIEDTNLLPGPDIITFALRRKAPRVIALLSPLPVISDPVNIYGPGNVEINGSLAGSANGFDIEADGTKIRGLSITGFSGHGISIHSPSVSDLATVDAMASGALPSESFSGTIAQADLADNVLWNESWYYNNPIPGGGGDDYGIVATGVLNVATAGEFSFALGNDDGARLRIDGVDVIVDDTLHAFENRFGSAELTAGAHSFEWVGFERGVDASFELSVAVGGLGDLEWFAPYYPLYYLPHAWKVVGDPSPAPEIALDGTIDVTAYYLNSHRVRNVVVANNSITNNSLDGVNIQQLPTLVESLADVDEMVAGTQRSESFVATIEQADLNDGFTPFENWSYNNPIPSGGGDDIGFVAIGVLKVTADGLYSFALSNDDGARLRIDGVDVIVDDTLHAFENRFGSAELTAGIHSFEWVGFERGVDAGFELSVAVGPLDAMDPYSPLSYYPDDEWKVVGDPSPAAEIALDGVIEVTAYYLTKDPDNIRIQSNVIAGNFGSGVNLWHVQGSTILSNELSFNSFAGVMLEISDGNNLTGNTANGCYVGVNVNASDGNHFTANTANGGYIGFYLYASAGNDLTANSADGNFGGIEVDYGDGNSLTGNSASGGHFGFQTYVSNNNTLTGNVATENNGDGFSLIFGQGNTYQGNTAIGNGGSGFVLSYNSSFNDLQGNSAVSNGGAGFGLYYFSTDNNLRENLAEGNGGGGFDLFYYSDFNTLTGNRAVGNTGNGFSLIYSSFNELSGNSSEGNAGNGFYLEGSYSNTLTYNSTLANGGYGMFVFEEDALDNVFENNELLDDLLGDFNFPVI